MKAYIAHSVVLKNNDIAEAKALLPEYEFIFIKTDKTIQPAWNPYFKQMWGDFKWLRSLMPDVKYNKGDIRCYLTSDVDLRAKNITTHLGMYDMTDMDGVLDFYFGLPKALDPRAKLNGFKSNFAWLLIHEALHGKEQNLGREYDRTHDWEAQGRLKELWATTTLIELLKSKVTKLMAMLKSISMPDTLFHPVQFKPLIISQVYGIASRRYPRTGRHIGTDYAVPIGTPLYAPWAGKVTTSGTTTTLGNFCHYEYEHGGQKWEERWCHLNVVPKLGAYKRADKVAVSGNTGQSTGPHLHREKWIDDVRIDLITRLNWANLTVDPEK